MLDNLTNIKQYPRHPLKDQELTRVHSRLTKQSSAINDNNDATNLNTAFRQTFNEDIVPEPGYVWVWDDTEEKWVPKPQNSIKVIAGEAISANKVITSSGTYADKDTESTIHQILGLSKYAANITELVDVIIAGDITNNTWNWTVGKPVWLGNTGELTQTPSATGFCVVIGYPINANTLNIRILEPIQLEEE